MTMRTVITYDIVSNRRRRRLAKLLSRHLTRVQKSVFEGILTHRILPTLADKMHRIMDPATDTIRIYHLCARCHQATHLLGTGPHIPDTLEDHIL